MVESTKENILNVITSCDTVQFCTIGLNEYPETRTIANMINKNKKDINDLTLYFLTNKYSHKIEQVLKNNNVCLYYFNQHTRRAMTLFGEVDIIFDKEEKSKFWMDDWLTFGYNGKDDESYCIIKFLPKTYKYYIGKNEMNGNI